MTAQCHGGHPDALVVDYRLEGGGDGIDAITALRTFVAREVPALLVTGANAPEDLAFPRERTAAPAQASPAGVTAGRARVPARTGAC